MHRTDAPGSSGGLYSNGSAGVDATTLRAQEQNALQEEIVNVILAAGMTLNTSSETTAQMVQLRDAIYKLIQGSLYDDVGAANHLVITGTGITAYEDGQVFTIRVAASNAAGSCDINIDSIGVKSIRWPNGSAISQAETLKAGAIITIRYDSANSLFQLITPSWENVLANISEVITARAGKASLDARLDATTLKAWCYFDVGAGPGYAITVQENENVASVVRDAVGKYTITFTSAFAAATYAAMVTPDAPGGSAVSGHLLARTTTTVQVGIVNPNGNYEDPGGGVSVLCMGALV